MKTILVLLATALCTLFFPSPSFSSAQAHDPHEHGAARMDLAVEGALAVITLESPLANFLSFEHTPETEGQKEEARALALRLREAKSLFRLNAEAGCRLEKVSLVSEPLEDILRDLFPQDAAQEEKSEEHGEGSAEHGDLDAEYSFRCDRPDALHSLEVSLFSVWPGLREIEVRMVTPAGQGAAELTPENVRVQW
jgi:hypothetical protein